MSWFKENKFLGGLIVVTVILAGVIIFFGMKLQGTLEENLADIDSKTSNVDGMKKLNPYPTPENAKAKTDSLKALLADANKMQAQFLAFKPASTDPIPQNDFSAALKNTHTKIEELFEGKIALPDSFYLGFETYKIEVPKPGSTGELAYELAALEWLMTEMEKAKVTEVSNIVRHQIPSERGETWDGAGQPAAGGKPGAKPKAPKGPKGPSAPKIANRMPIELTFKGPESSIRQVLSAMADSDQFYFETRIFRFKNEAPIPTKPRTRGGETAAAPTEESDDGFGNVLGAGDPAPAADAAPAAAAAPKKILDRIAGGDDVTAYLRVDLLLFTDGQQFPVIK